jgi:hypothetical protein
MSSLTLFILTLIFRVGFSADIRVQLVSPSVVVAQIFAK